MCAKLPQTDHKYVYGDETSRIQCTTMVPREPIQNTQLPQFLISLPQCLVKIPPIPPSYYGLLYNWHKIKFISLVSWGSLFCELPVNHYITINSMNILSQTYIRVVNVLIVVELWWFDLVGLRLRAICNITTPGNERIYIF